MEFLGIRDHSQYQQFQKRKLETFLKRVKVTVRHIKTREGKTVERIKTIMSVGLSGPVQQKFTLTDSTKGTQKSVTVADYFRDSKLDIVDHICYEPC